MAKTTLTDSPLHLTFKDQSIKIDFTKIDTGLSYKLAKALLTNGDLSTNDLSPKARYKMAKSCLYHNDAESAHAMVKNCIENQGDHLRLSDPQYFYKMAKIYIATNGGDASPKNALRSFESMKCASKDFIEMKLTPLGTTPVQEKSLTRSNIAGLQKSHAAFTPPVGLN